MADQGKLGMDSREGVFAMTYGRGGGSAATSDGATPPWLNLALEEYRGLRAEVLATLQTQHASLSFGTATLGILAAGAFNVWSEELVATVLFILVVPFICSLVLIVWMGELTRMMRAGEHLFALEQTLRQEEAFEIEAQGPVFAWETRLRAAGGRSWQRHYGWNYVAIIWMFLSLAAGSVLLGSYRGTHDLPKGFPLSKSLVHLVDYGMLVALVSVLAFLWWRLRALCPHRFGLPRFIERSGSGFRRFFSDALSR